MQPPSLSGHALREIAGNSLIKAPQLGRGLLKGGMLLLSAPIPTEVLGGPSKSVSVGMARALALAKVSEM